MSSQVEGKQLLCGKTFLQSLQRMRAGAEACVKYSTGKSSPTGKPKMRVAKSAADVHRQTGKFQRYGPGYGKEI